MLKKNQAKNMYKFDSFFIHLILNLKAEVIGLAATVSIVTSCHLKANLHSVSPKNVFCFCLRTLGVNTE